MREIPLLTELEKGELDPYEQDAVLKRLAEMRDHGDLTDNQITRMEECVRHRLGQVSVPGVATT